jgi:hypothetical protein
MRDGVMAKYNGHKNWNHWNVSLWINNDEELYRLAKHCIRRTDTRKEAAEAMLRQVDAETPDGAPYSVSAIKAAMVGM